MNEDEHDIQFSGLHWNVPGYPHVGPNKRYSPAGSDYIDNAARRHDIRYDSYLALNKRHNDPSSFNPYFTYNEGDEIMWKELANVKGPLGNVIRGVWALKKKVMPGMKRSRILDYFPSVKRRQSTRMPRIYQPPVWMRRDKAYSRRWSSIRPKFKSYGRRRYRRGRRY